MAISEHVPAQEKRLSNEILAAGTRIGSIFKELSPAQRQELLPGLLIKLTEMVKEGGLPLDKAEIIKDVLYELARGWDEHTGSLVIAESKRQRILPTEDS
jgi:hypothetical protein